MSNMLRFLGTPGIVSCKVLKLPWLDKPVTVGITSWKSFANNKFPQAGEKDYKNDKYSLSTFKELVTPCVDRITHCDVLSSSSQAVKMFIIKFPIELLKHSGLPQYLECENSWLFHDYSCPKLAIFRAFWGICCRHNCIFECTREYIMECVYTRVQDPLFCGGRESILNLISSSIPYKM